MSAWVLKSPRVLSLMGVLVLVVALGATSTSGWSAATAARTALGAIALGGLVAWLWRSRRARGGQTFQLAPPLAVLARAQLSPRNFATLLQAEGRSFLVVHGEGFANVTATKRPAAATPATERPKVAKPMALARTPRRRTSIRRLLQRGTP